MNAMNYIGLDIQEEHQLKGGERFTIWSEFDLLVEPGCNAGKGLCCKPGKLKRLNAELLRSRGSLNREESRYELKLFGNRTLG